MIYITGDTHSDFSRFDIDRFHIQNKMTKNDYVIICGDFGGVWNYLVESTYEKYWLDWLNERYLNLDEEERIYTYRKRGAFFRIRDYSWWDLEMPTKEEMENGIRNLEKVNFKIDYIITHCCPTSVQAILSGGLYKKDCLTDYLQKISEKCKFKKWYFGHYHENRQVNSQFVLLYEDIVPLKYESIF